MGSEHKLHTDARERSGNLRVAQSGVAQLHKCLPPQSAQRSRTVDGFRSASRLRLSILFNKIEQLKSDGIRLRRAFRQRIGVRYLTFLGQERSYLFGVDGIQHFTKAIHQPV
jgi:hypothetical protein